MLLTPPDTFPAVELEWVVPDSAPVTAGQVVAWLRLPEHCNLRPLLAPAAGTLTRWPELLPFAAPGDAVGAIDATEAEAQAVARAARRRARERLSTVQAELEGLGQRATRHPTAAALLASERERLERLRAALAAWAAGEA